MPRSFATLSLSLSAIPASASSLFRHRTFYQIGMLERQTFCGQKYPVVLHRFDWETVKEPLTFKQRVLTLMIVLQHQPWHFPLQLTLWISLTFYGCSFIRKVMGNVIAPQAFSCKIMMVFAVNICIWWEILRSSQDLGLTLANCLKKDFD